MCHGGGVIGFLHTSEVHVATFDSLLARHGAAGRGLHRLAPELLERARLEGPESVRAAVTSTLGGLVADGARVVVCTCSTIGAPAEEADVAVDVLRVDRPMARRAAALADAGAGRVTALVAVASTLGPTRELFASEASPGTEVTLRVVDGAWERFEAGDLTGYLDLVADTARGVATTAPVPDVVVLAQASMAGAVERCDDLAVPVLAGPDLAVAAALALLGP